ncbi:MAG: agmatine deiminase family protein [Acidobacteriota bacterium]|nr:agmatine deiminase family protein [Acidobacteriota bacterium]MDE3044936.1 agmatine deiminase family protein [Acidobacteriota bacterium]
MPAEWEPHERTWLAFPPANATFGDEGSATLDVARTTWASVATTIARYEPVTLIARPGDGERAQSIVGPGVNVVEHPINDAWIRDSGPTFTVDRQGELGAVNWVFNGWGAQPWAAWDHDARLGAEVAQRASAAVRFSTLTNEGGGLHVDGAGTVLLTETVQLDPQRNPDWTRDQVEAEIHAQLGTAHAIWLPRGLTRDYDEFGTRGHVDIVATFVRSGLVAAHVQRDATHPDFEVSREIVALLRASVDVTGRPLEVVEIPAPRELEADGTWADYSYINHYVGNGFVLVGTFDDPADDVALELLARLYPGRRVERANGRAIFAHGGGVHCITQQQPRAS